MKIKLSLGTLVVSGGLLLSGCARENTMTAVVMFKHPQAQLIYSENNDERGFYFLCEERKLVFIKTNRALLRARILEETILPPDLVTCTNTDKAS